MADTPTAPSSEPSTPPSSAADQARIRKERREAKIRAGGSARLDRITGLGGGVQRDAPVQPKPQAAHADPEEVDISQHYYEPNNSRPRMNNAFSSPALPNGIDDEDALRQMMLGFDPNAPMPPPGANPFTGFPGMGGDAAGGGPNADDPMMKMLQQMMAGGMPGAGGAAGGMPSLFPGMPGGQNAPAAAASDPYAYLWRITHAIFALTLGLYIALSTSFNGTKIARERGYNTSAGDDELLRPGSVYFFYVFATAEVLLQTSRFWVEKGRVQQGMVLGMITGFLPEPYKGWVMLASRYARIWTTVSTDAMVLLFVLGLAAWWRGS